MRRESVKPGWGSLWGAFAGATPGPIASLLPGAIGLTAPEISLITLGGSAAGLAAGLSWDTLPGSALDEWLRSLCSIFEKADEDFAGTIFNSWQEIDRANRVVAKRRDRLEEGPFRARKVLESMSPDSLRSYLKFSDCRNGNPRPDSIWQLDRLDQIVVLSSTLHTGAELALLIMMEDFGLRIQLIDDCRQGVDQMRYMASNADVDFALIVDANVQMIADERFNANYLHLLPCFWNKQYLVERGLRTSYQSRRLFVADRSTAHEQALIGSTVLEPFGDADPKVFDIQDLPDRIRDLDEGAGVLSWSPVTQINSAHEDRITVTQCSDYDFSTSLYCNRRFYRHGSAILRNAFQDCLIAAWNRAKIDRAGTVVRLAARGDYRVGFRRGAVPPHRWGPGATVEAPGR